MRYIIALVIALLAAQAYTYSLAADARAENAALRRELNRELHNVKGHLHDQAQTIQHLTHPATMHRRTIDWLYGQGEFKK
ncbi:hypothetical protein [Anaeroselena agilis]|uniref:Uncharacterized protein n=1 Tax=Anaeroselena agilis TaxID=3063788 RepID=A0ABU3NWG1_9FIRM|nr:hypothetical protein [Selenomonadales bacterium 4137-cl]